MASVPDHPPFGTNVISRDSPLQAAADLIKSGRFSELAMIASAASYYIQ